MKDSSDKSESQDHTEEDVRTEFLQLWGKLVAQSWEDEVLRQRLLNEPAAVLTEYGAEFPKKVQVKVIQDADNTIYLPLPPKPDSTELGDEELDEVAGGQGKSSGFSFKGRSIERKGAGKAEIGVAIVTVGVGVVILAVG